MKRSRLAPLALALLLVGCRSDEAWTFGLSREVYDSDRMESFADSLAPDAACVALIAFAVPVTLDLVFLPVALVRDWRVLGTPF